MWLRRLRYFCMRPFCRWKTLVRPYGRVRTRTHTDHLCGTLREDDSTLDSGRILYSFEGRRVVIGWVDTSKKHPQSIAFCSCWFGTDSRSWNTFCIPSCKASKQASNQNNFLITEAEASSGSSPEPNDSSEMELPRSFPKTFHGGRRRLEGGKRSEVASHYSTPRYIIEADSQ